MSSCCGGCHALGGELPCALQADPRRFEVGHGRRLLRLGRREVRFGLADLFVSLLLLVAQARPATAEICDVIPSTLCTAYALSARSSSGEITAMIWPALHDVALLHAKVVDAAANLRADDDVVGGHHAGEDERDRLATEVEVGAGAESGQQEERKDFLHECSRCETHV